MQLKKMTALTYYSRSRCAFDQHALDELVRLAYRANQYRAITGYLYFEKGQFVQYIEGKNDAITTLMHSITHDARHEVIYVAKDTSLTQRRFHGWHMKQLVKNDLVQIKLEHIWIDMFRFIYEKPAMLNPDRIWNVVDRIAALS